MSVVSTSFYKRKMCKVEDERRQQEFEHLKTVLLNRLSDIDEKRSKFEERQTKFNDLIEDLRSMIHNNNK
jgi:replicative DNA helicase